MMDPTAEAAFAEFLKGWPTRGVVNKEFMPADMRQEYRRAFVAGFIAGQLSPALDEPGKEEVDDGSR